MIDVGMEVARSVETSKNPCSKTDDGGMCKPINKGIREGEYLGGVGHHGSYLCS